MTVALTTSMIMYIDDKESRTSARRFARVRTLTFSGDKKPSPLRPTGMSRSFTTSRSDGTFVVNSKHFGVRRNVLSVNVLLDIATQISLFRTPTTLTGTGEPAIPPSSNGPAMTSPSFRFLFSRIGCETTTSGLPSSGILPSTKVARIRFSR